MNLSFNHSNSWSFALLLVAAAAAAVWFYRRVPPPVGGHLRKALMALRIAALSVIILTLLEPVARFERVVAERPVVAVLVDVSRSMSISDGTGGVRRGNEAVDLLNGVVIPRVARDADVDIYTFSSELRTLSLNARSIEGMPTCEGDATDLAAALTGLKRSYSGRNLGAVVLATDGAVNRGGSPYGPGVALGAPVYALGVGSSDEALDVAVVDPLINRVSYVGDAVPIEARVVGSGFESARTSVTLSEGGVAIDTRTVNLPGTGEEVPVLFRAIPASPGVHTYTVSVPEVPGEISVANNARVVSTNVFKRRIRALLAAPRPSWEYAFARRALEGDGNIDLTAVVLREGSPVHGDEGLPGSIEELFEYDVAVLVDADWSTPLVSADWLLRFIRERGGGLFLVGLPPRDQAGGGLAETVPVRLTSSDARPEREARVRLTALGEGASTTRVSRDRLENVTVWESLPPVWTAVDPWWTAKPESHVLAVARGDEGRDVPVYVGSREGAGSVLALLADGVWRWKLAGPDGVDVYDRVMVGAARWLTAGGELERATVTTDKDVYAAGERIRLSAQVYRGDYTLARDARVVVSISRGSGAVPVETVGLIQEGDFHRGAGGPLAPGRYVFRGVASIGTEEVGEASGEFAVEEFSLEDAEGRRRPSTLRRMASETGGLYFTPETMEELPDSVPLERRSASVDSEFELWNSPWPLLIMAGLLSTEWALRRRKGLP